MDATPRARVDGVPAKNIQHSAVARSRGRGEPFSDRRKCSILVYPERKCRQTAGLIRTVQSPTGRGYVRYVWSWEFIDRNVSFALGILLWWMADFI